MTISLTEQDEATVKEALLLWRSEGNLNPLIPIGDVDGDGFEDSFGLDENDQLIVVSGAPLEDTVFVSDGTGVEADREGDVNG